MTGPAFAAVSDPVSIRESLNWLGPRHAAGRDLGHQAILHFIAAGEDIRKALRYQLARDGLTVDGFQTLAALRQEPGPSRASALSQKTGTTRALLSHTLNRLEMSQLIRRQRGVDDRRVVWVELTPLGRATIEKASVTCDRTMDELVRLFDKSALAELIATCSKLSQGAAALGRF